MFYSQLLEVLFNRRFIFIFFIIANAFTSYFSVLGLFDSGTSPEVLPWYYTKIKRFNGWKVEPLPLLSVKVATTNTTSTTTFLPTKLKNDRQFRAESNNHTSNHYSPCENNGAFVNGKCHCYYPYMGVRCTDFACEHGLSVGPRYDSESVFFNRKCICDEDWAGELCNIPIADQCNERGQYIGGRCKCHGYYFGPKCQYVGKCTNGKLLEGVCVCNYGYEGDYCDKIVCHHGYRDKSNNSNSCVCPPRHSGIFCDECMLTGDYILPFPNCTEEKIPHRARISRKKTDDEIISRLFIIGLILLLLALIASAMFFLHWGKERATHYDSVAQHCGMVRQRKETLERVIFQQSTGNSMLIGSSNNVNGNRRSSRFADPLRLEHDLL